MNNNQIIWLMILIPFISVYSLLEIRRGWNILRNNRLTLNLALKTRIKLIESFRGKDVAEQYRSRLLNDPKEMRSLGLNSIFGGSISLIICVIWTIILYKSLVR